MALIVGNNIGSSGKKDICTDGLSCGLACISRNKECLKNLSPEAAKLYTQVRDIISLANEQLIQKAAGGDKKALKQLKKLDESISTLVDEVSKGNLSEEQLDVIYDIYVDRGSKAIARSGMTNTEIREIRKSSADSQKLFDDIENDLQSLDVDNPDDFNKFIENRGINTGTGERSIYQGDKVTKETSNAVWELLPDKVKSKFIKSGSVQKVPKVVDFETDANGNIISQTRQTSDNVSRGKAGGQAMWNLWMRNQGRDIYTGEPLDIRNAELEHISGLTGEFKDGTVNSSVKDTLGNLGWVSQGVNGSKSDQRMEKWLGDVNDDAYVDNYFQSRQKKATTKGGAEAKASNYRNVTGSDRRGFIKGGFKNRDDISKHVINNIVKGQHTVVINKALKQAEKVGKKDTLQKELDDIKNNNASIISDQTMKRLIKAEMGTAASGKSWVRNNPEIVSIENKPNKNGSRGRGQTHSSNAMNVFLSNFLSETSSSVKQQMMDIWTKEIKDANAQPGGMNKKAFQAKVLQELDKIPQFELDI